MKDVFISKINLIYNKIRKLFTKIYLLYLLSHSHLINIHDEIVYIGEDNGSKYYLWKRNGSLFDVIVKIYKVGSDKVYYKTFIKSLSIGLLNVRWLWK